MIYEWKLDGEIRNFGDALHEVLIPGVIRQDMVADQEKMYFLVGSVICNEIMDEVVRLGLTPVFINCGWRGETLNLELVKSSEFYGARGPNTQMELSSHGVQVEVTGDPGYEIPKLFPKCAPNGLAMVIRHIKDPADYNRDAIFELKADAIFSPVVETYDDIVEMIQKISGARFVLAGSMHAAIIAHAYGVPFAPFSSGYIDCLPKWQDWMADAGLGEPVFCSNVVEGRAWYRSVTSMPSSDS